MRANSTAKERATGAAHHLHLSQGAPGINAHVAGDSSAPAREGTSRTASGKRRGCRTSSPSLTPSRHGPVPPVPVTTPSPQAPSAARLHYQPVAATTTSTCTSDLNCQPAEDFPHLDSYQELPQSGSGELGNAARGNTARGGAKGRPPRHSGSRGRGGSRTGRNGGRRTVATSSGRGAVASSSGGRAAAASSSGGPTTQTRFGDGMPEEEEETMGMDQHDYTTDKAVWTPENTTIFYEPCQWKMGAIVTQMRRWTE
ncbi:hypothetical protein EJB05_57648 [Eragrostis curvula]|uniref:Uncharacterized protein n=1 Tax=Eragrostis curvula TaxID=38414 RepID=A0A5J9SDD5_9POAL|nr:hypothetical protein EJB05_57648 [Eragrostis curvula]